MNEQTTKLYDEGYCLCRDVFDTGLIERLRSVTDRLLDAVPTEERERMRYQGSSIPVKYQDPAFSELVGWPGSLDALALLGFEDPKFWAGYILSKPAHGPPLYWHQDWIFWDDPVSADPDPGQLFLMIYLVDTNVFNGCLRVIPGTHRRRIDLHGGLDAAHTEDAQQADESSNMFTKHPDEVNMEVKAGDLVIGDARVLHAAHGNQSDHRRTCITLWYNPFFDRFPDAIKATLVECVDHVEVPDDVTPPELGERLRRLKPHYAGDAQPREWVREPADYLPV
jgi:hypothetical protein